MKKWKNCCQFTDTRHTENFQLMPPPPLSSLSLHFLECQWKQEISIGHYENMIKSVWVSNFTSVGGNKKNSIGSGFNTKAF